MKRTNGKRTTVMKHTRNNYKRNPNLFSTVNLHMSDRQWEANEMVADGKSKERVIRYLLSSSNNMKREQAERIYAKARREVYIVRHMND